MDVINEQAVAEKIVKPGIDQARTAADEIIDRAKAALEQVLNAALDKASNQIATIVSGGVNCVGRTIHETIGDLQGMLDRIDGAEVTVTSDITVKVQLSPKEKK